MENPTFWRDPAQYFPLDLIIWYIAKKNPTLLE